MWTISFERDERTMMIVFGRNLKKPCRGELGLTACPLAKYPSPPPRCVYVIYGWPLCDKYPTIKLARLQVQDCRLLSFAGQFGKCAAEVK